MNLTTKIILFNIIGLIIGLFIGGIVNMGIILISEYVIPTPDGYINTDIESMTNTFHLLKPKHMIMPWLAHGTGTLMGSIVAVKIVKSKQLFIAFFIGCFYLIGGIMMVIMLPSPIWFNTIDLGFAYIPMAWLGYKLATIKFISK